MRALAPALLAGIFAAATAGAFDGRVVTEDGEPAKAATVSIVGQAGSTTTDGDGRFSWRPDPKPPFGVLVLLAEGRIMAPVVVTSIPADGSLTIRLEAVVEEVAVTAGAAPYTEGPAAAALTLLSGADLEERKPSRLADALESVPGAGRSDGVHTGVPSLRGLARGRTLVLLDGARVTTERRAGPSAGFLDPFFLDGIEIVRGPGGVAYGSDALGGVIHARTRRPEPGAAGSVRLLATTGAGLPESGVGLEYSQGSGSSAWLVQARRRTFDDYTSPLGVVPNSAASERGLLVRTEHDVPAGRLSFGFEIDEGRDVGKPVAGSSRSRTYYPREDSRRAVVAFEPPASERGVKLSFQSFLGSYRLVTDRDTAASADEGRSIARADVDARDYGLRATAAIPTARSLFRVGLDLNGRFGLEADDSRFTYDLAGNLVESVTASSIEDARRGRAAIYTTAETQLASPLTLHAGLRVDRVGTRSVGGLFGSRSDRDVAVSGFGAVTAKLPASLELTGQIARGYREPTLSDLYFVGPTGRGTITGNPLLLPETSLQLDVSLRRVAERSRFGIYVYDYRIDDLIERYETEPDVFAMRNRGRARIRGVELEAQRELPRGFRLEIGAHVVRGRAEDDGSALDDVPARSVALQLRKGFGPKVDAGARIAVFARDRDPGPTETTVPGYGTLDLFGGWSVSRRFELRLALRNVLDRAYASSADAKAVLAPGRAGALTLVVKTGA